jgi:hypothetical protein
LEVADEVAAGVRHVASLVIGPTACRFPRPQRTKCRAISTGPTRETALVVDVFVLSDDAVTVTRQPEGAEWTLPMGEGVRARLFARTLAVEPFPVKIEARDSALDDLRAAIEERDEDHLLVMPSATGTPCIIDSEVESIEGIGVVLVRP